ncbi:hypothetical protein AB836_01785 [Rickettsiales bacterium (ex Bugula neritina AB1)]|nr:hypothetical protein AB836_01785 [Rickettsiales bacterium (ex Bugula neritina AB1)]
MEKNHLFVSIIGIPNSGKSSIINTILNRKIVAVSNKPQTTIHNHFSGVLTIDNNQIVFTDTPGVNKNSGSNLNRLVNSSILNENNTLNIFTFPANKPINSKILMMSLVVKNKIALITKIDLIKKMKLLPITAFLKENGFKEILYISVKDIPKNGIKELVDFLIKKTVPGKWLYNKNISSNMCLQEKITEATREIIFQNFYEEIPYEVIINTTSIKSNQKNELIVYQNILIKKSAHHIILGKIKEISMLAAKNIKSFTGKKCHLYIDIVN